MHVYKLDDKKMDEAFLRGIPVTGKAVLNSKANGSVSPDDTVLVILSNGKKYKGRVTNSSFFRLKDYEVGEIEITKTT